MRACVRACNCFPPHARGRRESSTEAEPARATAPDRPPFHIPRLGTARRRQRAVLRPCSVRSMRCVCSRAAAAANRCAVIRRRRSALQPVPNGRRTQPPPPPVGECWTLRFLSAEDEVRSAQHWSLGGALQGPPPLCPPPPPRPAPRSCTAWVYIICRSQGNR